MKRSGLISLICSLVAVMVLCLSIVLVLIFTDVIRVVPEELVISSASASVTYDGEALTDQNWSLMKGELKKGHRLSVVVSGSQTNVGISENYVFATVLDDNGTDVSEDYKIEYKPGALNVKARAITLTADSKMKVYDGEPLSADGFNIDSPISLVSTHEIDATVEGTITDVGIIDNLITNVVIKNSKGVDVTKNYRIKTKPGKLAVYSQDTLIFETESDVYEYTGEPLTNSNWKLKSGKLKDSDRIVATVSGTQTDVGTSENTISVVILNGNGEDVTSNYEIVYDPGKLTVIPKEITITAGSAQKVYDGASLKCTDFTVSPDCVDKSRITLDVSGAQTEVGSSENVASNAVIKDENGKDITANYDITYLPGTLRVESGELKPELTFESFSSEKSYDGEPLENSNWKLAEGALKPGHKAEVAVNGSITDAGMIDNTFSVVIKDEAGNDVTDEYFIETEFGKLTVNKVELVVTADSAEKVYDGEPLTKGTYTLSNPIYADKFTFNVSIVGQQTDVGSSPNVVASCNVMDAENNNVTQNFSIKKAEGVLTVVATEAELKPTLVYNSGSSKKAYDGTPLANDECYRISGILLEGHTEYIEITQAQTEIGSVANTFKVTILDGETDVTDMYNIVSQPGTLEVTPVEITIVTAGESRTYDGTALTLNSYEVIPANPTLPGHTLAVEIIGTITEPGVTENNISNYTITDADGNDVSNLYKVTVKTGTLEVLPIYFKIISNDAQKRYDGNPLTDDGYTLLPGNLLLPGHELEVLITGTITLPGEAPNTIENVKIQTSAGEDVSRFYKVDKEEGTLAVTVDAIFITAKDQAKYYDGTPLVASEFTVYPENVLNEIEFEVEFSGEITEPGSVASVITGYTAYDKATGEDITDNLLVTTKNGTLTVKRIPLKITSKGAIKEYDGFPLTNNGEDGYMVESVAAIPANHELTVVLSGSITEPGQVYNTIEDVIITDENDVNVISLYYDITRIEESLVVTKKLLTIIAPTAERQYNGEVLEDGICTYEYASALIDFHTIRVDVEGSILFPGTVDNLITDYTIKDNDGKDVSYCYDVTLKDGTLTVTSIHIKIESLSNTKIYDGEPLEAKVCEIIPDDALLQGHVLTVEATGSITNPGWVMNTIGPYTIVDEATGEDVSAGYEVEIKEGKLIISQHKIAIIAGSAEKVYDGLPLECDEYETVVFEGYLPDSYEVTAEISGEITEPGEVDNEILSWTIRDANGNDVTLSYEVEPFDGKLTVTKATVTVTASDAEKYYDGEPLTSPSYEATASHPLPKNVTLEATVEGSITEPGVADNVVSSVVIKRGNLDISDCFEIIKKPGTLEVKQVSLSIKSGNAKKDYDGTPLTNYDLTIVGDDKIPDIHTLKIDVLGTITEPGEVDNEFTYDILDANGESVRKYYSVETQFGKLKVDFIELVIKSNDAEKLWDGTPLVDDGYEILLGKVLEEHTIDVGVTGSITDPGTAPNTISEIKITDGNGTDVTYKYYSVDCIEGDLLVYTSDFVVKANSDSKPYDGTPLTNSGYTVFGELPPGYTYTVEIAGSITEIGTATNTATVVVKDSKNNDVTDLISMEVIPGVLEVTQRSITIEANSDNKEYDGKPLQNSGYRVVFGDSLLPGHTLNATVEGSITLPGKTDNVITGFTVTDEEENDVSGLYNIHCNKGKLTVEKIELRIETESDSKFYDGTPLVNAGYQVDSLDKLIPGHTLTVEVTGTITEPGEVYNTFTVSITDESDNDVKALYYNVTEIKGKLSVDKIKIKVTSKDAEKTYDGQPLSESGYDIVGTYPEDCELVVVVGGSRTEIGESKNTITQCILLDKNGHPVSEEFAEITRVEGTLTVKRIVITVKAGSATKEYDGLPLTNSTFEVLPSEDLLLDGHTVKADVVGSITEIGSTQNIIENCWVEDENGADVSHYYSITSSPGSLEVKGKTVYFKLEGKANEYLHLKMESYGDYDKESNTWQTAPQYSGLTCDGYSAYHLFSFALQDNSQDDSMKTVKITPLQGKFALPYHTYTSNSTYKQTSDTVISGNASGQYSVNYFTWNRTSSIILPEDDEEIDYKSFEEEYREFVYDNYLYVDDETLDFMKDFIIEKELNPNDSQIIDKVAKVIKRSARYNLLFNTKLETEENVIISFLSEYKEGVCRHYAAAATMLFRTLGIPARYTEGFAATTDSKGKADVTSGEAHAWVEVYIDGCGWEMVEVTGTGNSTDGSDKPKVLTVAPTNVTKKYDGTTLYPKQTVSGLSALEKEGYTYKVTVEGENSALGTTKSRITQLQIYDPFEYLVYDKQAGIGHTQFIITYEEGNLKNYIAKVKFGSNSYKKQYNGVPLVVTESDCYYIPGADTIPVGHTYEFVPTGRLETVKVEKSEFKVIMRDENNNDCTEFYEISYEYGTLQLTPRELTVTAKSKDKVYDGTPLECNEIEYDETLLAEGDYIASFTVRGTVPGVGSSANVVGSVVIKNQDGKVVTGCYVLKFNDGKLTVYPS